MTQIAIFVDAGYLCAQGASLLSGMKRTRSSITLSVPEVLTQLAESAKAVAPGSRLLRTYWYDGLLRIATPTSEQDAIAKAPNTKLRLGMVNSHGKQRGVDSLIVTDIIELARNGAISDALVIRVAVHDWPNERIKAPSGSRVPRRKPKQHSPRD